MRKSRCASCSDPSGKLWMWDLTQVTEPHLKVAFLVFSAFKIKFQKHISPLNILEIKFGVLWTDLNDQFSKASCVQHANVPQFTITMTMKVTNLVQILQLYSQFFSSLPFTLPSVKSHTWPPCSHNCREQVNSPADPAPPNSRVNNREKASNGHSESRRDVAIPWWGKLPFRWKIFSAFCCWSKRKSHYGWPTEIFSAIYSSGGS